MEELRAASSAEILAAILAVQRDAHWCRAVGCPPEPAFMVPVSVGVALGQYDEVQLEPSSDSDDGGEQGWAQAGGGGAQRWWPRPGYSLWRALEAARKRSWLLPNDLCAPAAAAAAAAWDAGESFCASARAEVDSCCPP